MKLLAKCCADIQGSNLNVYLGAALLLVAVRGLSQPVITQQPISQSVSLGASVSFQVSATTTNPPISYQWRLDITNLLSSSGAELTLTNIQPIDAGDYDVVVSDRSGSKTSQVAHLEVDPTFTKLTTGAVVSDQGLFQAAAWGDYDNDGFEDMFVANQGKSVLYRNNRDGTFTRITNDVVGSVSADSSAAVWGDFDNDGWLDLFVANFNGQNNFLFHNNGDGTFTRIVSGQIVSDGGDSSGCSWGDFDNDGFLDLFVSNLNQSNFLYHNNGDGTTFSKITTGPIVTSAASSFGCPWGDYNNDGLLDLAIASSPRNLLFTNNGDGTFSSVTAGPVVTDPISFGDGCAWADYDNDGWLDLFVTDASGGGNRVYHNSGGGTFTKVTNTVITLDRKVSTACAWADYDNDGYVDLFVANGFGNNFLFHNRGDGTFTKILSGSLVNDAGESLGCAWADYDNDGFQDLFVANTHGSNFLYRNNGNDNTWVKFKLVGTASNRAAIGAKVRLKATIFGKMFWQLRVISSGDGFSQNSLVAHFGLGDATNVDCVRIEWPSGIVQELQNVAPKQLLTITEPSRLLVINTNGSPQIVLRGGFGLRYNFETSTNLVMWSFLTTLTISNRQGLAPITNANAPAAMPRFYRASQIRPGPAQPNVTKPRIFP